MTYRPCHLCLGYGEAVVGKPCPECSAPYHSHPPGYVCRSTCPRGRKETQPVPNQPKTPLHSFRCPDALWDAAKAKADETGETLTYVLRKALTDYVKRRERTY